MKCMNCGSENTGSNQFCYACGSPLPSQQSSQTEQALRLLRDNLFLIMCILYSICIVFTLISCSLPIIETITAVFLWLLFAQGRAQNVNIKHMSCISGLLFVTYVLNWVCYCLTILASCFIAFLSFFINIAWLQGMFYSALKPFMSESSMFFDILAYASNALLLIVSIALVIVAIIGLVFNVLGWRSIHRFAQSLYKNLENGQKHIVKIHKAQTWLLIYGIFSAIGAVAGITTMNPSAFLASACLAATRILGSVLIQRHYGNSQP